MILKKYQSLILFILGFGIFMFSRASKIIPFILDKGIAIIIAPIFILGFIRTQTTKKGIFLTFLGFLLSLNIALWGLYGNELILFSLVNSSLLAILFSLPYIADRLIYPKFKEKEYCLL